jgi:hypothetical protein
MPAKCCTLHAAALDSGAAGIAMLLLHKPCMPCSKQALYDNTIQV